MVLIAAANAAEASNLAETLVGERLAACVQILQPMSSVFRWKGAVQHQNEILLIAKTKRFKFEELERQVRVLHSYETPEIIALPVTAVSLPYLKWLSASLDPRGS